jgi:hypothetical protein
VGATVVDEDLEGVREPGNDQIPRTPIVPAAVDESDRVAMAPGSLERQVEALLVQLLRRYLAPRPPAFRPER